MDSDRIKQPLNQFVKKISNSVKVERVIVFGSYLEGNATKDSDIDVFIISDDFKTLDEDQRLDILYDATDNIDNTEPDIHPWGYTQEELERASRLTLMGYVRDNGIHYDPLKI
jgi:uncharacterized protein